MIPFLVIVPILLMIAFIGSNRLSKQSNNVNVNKRVHKLVISLEKLICVLLLLSFWFLTAFRSIYIGNDTWNYVNIFSIIATQGIMPTFYMEIGYQYFNLFVSKIFGHNPHVFLIVCATISYFGITLYILKKSKNYYLSVCLTFCLLFSCYTNLIRQGLAMVLGIIAYQFILKNKFFQAAAMIVLAMSIHYSAIVLFALFFYKYIPKNYTSILIISALLFSISISGSLNELFIQIASRYQNYFESERVGTGYLALGYSLFYNLFFCLLAYMSYKDGFSLVHQKRLVIFVASLLITCLSFNMNLISRLNNYYSILMIVELPNLFYDLKSRNRMWFAWGTCTAMIVSFILVQMLRPEWNHIIPYEFWSD